MMGRVSGCGRIPDASFSGNALAAARVISRSCRCPVGELVVPLSIAMLPRRLADLVGIDTRLRIRDSFGGESHSRSGVRWTRRWSKRDSNPLVPLENGQAPRR
jgi:hypothetical protein